MRLKAGNAVAAVSPVCLRYSCVDHFAVGFEGAHAAAIVEQPGCRCVGFFRAGIEIATFEMCSGLSLSTMAGGPFHRVRALVLLDAIRLHEHVLEIDTRNTVPRLPLSLPVMTITSSSFLILRILIYL